MKSVSSRLFILGLLIALGQGMASRAEAGAPTWSKKIAGAPRFKPALDGGAVLDQETNLIWEKSPDTTARNWLDAQDFCNNKIVDGRGGWRLPTVQEMTSLTDQTQFGPALPIGHPFTNVQSDYYWLATASAGFPNEAWLSWLPNGVVRTGLKTLTYFVWCVRGSQGSSDAQ